MRTLVLFLFLFAVLFPASTIAQKDPSKRKTYEVTVNSTDAIVKIELLAKQKKISPVTGLVYFWYKSNKIISTEGGIDGKPLHGNYTSFYLSNNLMEKGRFKYGLKNGEWRSWNENGKLKETINWNKGIKHGKHILYNSLGELVVEGNYRKGKLHGIVKSYERGALLSERNYKNGEEVLLDDKEVKKGQKEKFSLKEHWQKLKNKLTENKDKEKKKESSEKKPKEAKTKKEKEKKQKQVVPGENKK